MWSRSQLSLIVSLLLATSVGHAARPGQTSGAAGKPIDLLKHQVAPWRARIRIPSRFVAQGHSLLHPEKAAAEPASPATVDAKRFAEAFVSLCGLKAKKIEQYAQMIIDASNAEGIDAFTLGALVYGQSRCRAKTRSKLGVGLSRINPRIHRRYVDAGQYHYWIHDGQRWVERRRSLPGRLTVRALLDARTNIRFAATLFAMYSEQAPSLRKAFKSVAYRHPVSHMVWGDRVRNTASEERIMRNRRRLLQYYGSYQPQPTGHYKTLTLRSPLDGSPRKITSGMGAIRDNGRRSHKGVDFHSTTGEPVRAVADGVVYFAGYTSRRGKSRPASPAKAAAMARRRLGKGGLFVIVRHQSGLDSAYFHLRDFQVKRGQKLKQGDIIGHVGRTGIRHSDPHLHFELRRGYVRLNPMKVYGDELIPPSATYHGRFTGRKARRYWRKKRAARAKRLAKKRRKRLRARKKIRAHKKRSAHKKTRVRKPKFSRASKRSRRSGS